MCVCVCVFTSHNTKCYTGSRTGSDFSGRTYTTSLEAFAATESNEIFSGRQPGKDVKVSRRFRD